ncbi:MAG: hypothetical protein AAB354_00365, partial [candidate division KSB1 bacterium]
MKPNLLSEIFGKNSPLEGGVLSEVRSLRKFVLRKNTPLKGGIVLGLVLVLCLLAKVDSTFAQNFNPTFPRIGVIYFYEANIPEEIWRHHDLIVTRLWYPEIARRVKQAYPDKLVIACNNVIDGNTLQPPDAWLVPTLNNSCLKGWHDNSHPGDCLYDGTDRCPLVNGERWNTYLAKKIHEKT